MIRICSFFIHFINSNNHWYTCLFCMRDTLECLRFYSLISSYYKNSNICRFRSSRTHHCKCLMSWSIQKSDFLISMLYLISSDTLSNSPSFSLCNFFFTDMIQKRGFSMIYMPHNTDNWRSWL